MCTDHVNYPMITCHLITSNDNDFEYKRENIPSMTIAPSNTGHSSSVDGKKRLIWVGSLVEKLNKDKWEFRLLDVCHKGMEP